jgi:O-antigen ligase
MASVGLALCLILLLIWGRADARGFVAGALPLSAFLVWALLAPLIAGRPPSGTGFARWLDWCALPAAAWAYGLLDDRSRRVWQALLGGALLLSCLAAGLQSFGIWPQPSAVPSTGIGHWVMHWLTNARIYEPAPGGRFMGGGLLFHRLKFAHVSGLAVLMAFGLALRSQGRARWMAAAVAGIGLASIALFPFARSALVALSLSLACVGVVGARHRRRALALAALLLIVGATAIGLSPTLRSRFQGSMTSEGSGGRPQLWATGLRAVQAHPWVGVGQGRFHPGDFVQTGVSVHEAQETVKAHDQFLTVAAESGVFGLVLFIALLGWLYLRLEGHTGEGLGAKGAVIFFVLLSGVHDPLFHAPFSMGLVLALGVGLGAGAPRRSDLRNAG